MIKFGAINNDDDPVLGIGLTEDVLQGITKEEMGRLINIPPDQVEKIAGWRVGVSLFYGKTDKRLMKSLRRYFGPETRVTTEIKNYKVFDDSHRQ